jgi:FAD/FMN-containing dehydrogenase
MHATGTFAAYKPVAQNVSISRLRADLVGRVITPNDPDYDTINASLSMEYVRRPAVIVRPADEIDIAHVVTVARETGMELAIRGGGHSLAGFSTSDGGIVLDLSQMKGFYINEEERTVWAEAGLTAGEYTAEAAKYGLATGFGDTASVGIGGLTTGGGIGYLVRKYGLTIDNLLAAEVVTADGEIRHVDAETHPDLFWAIRGGGGNFGVVTRFQLKLHPVDTIIGGPLVLPATPEVITAYIDLAQAAPDELSSIVSIMPALPLPFIPEEYHGQVVLMAMMAYVGDPANSEAVYAPFRALAEPIADMIGPMPYPQIYHPEDPNFHPIASLRSMFIDAIDAQQAQIMVDQVTASSAMMPFAEFRVLGGAMARVPADATVFAHRSARIMMSFIAVYENRDERDAHDAWAKDAAAAFYQGESGVYVNFVGNEGQARVRDAYSQNWERLASIKAQYDPTNFFHKNHNIAPDVK